MKYLKLIGMIIIIVLVNIGVIIFALSYKNHVDAKSKKELDEKRKMEIQKFINNILYVKTIEGKTVTYTAYAIDNEFFEKTGLYILVKVEELTNNKELLKKKIQPIIPPKKEPEVITAPVPPEQTENKSLPKVAPETIDSKKPKSSKK